MKIFLAGMEQKDSVEVISKGLVRNAFLSYYYLRNKKADLSFFRKNIKTIIIDSGAHTFFAERAGEGLSVSNLKKKTKTKEEPEAYFQRYKNWALKNKDYFDYFVELDIGEIVGQDTVLRWRNELKEVGIYNKCITVYHPNCMSYQDYIDTLEDSQSKYIALEGDRNSRTRLPYLKLVKECFDRDIKVHGFALNKQELIERIPFYSVDSTSWKAGAMYGLCKSITTKGRIIVNFKVKDKFVKLKGEGIMDIHSDNKKIQREKMFELSIKAYNQQEDHITGLWNKRGIIWK